MFFCFAFVFKIWTLSSSHSQIFFTRFFRRRICRASLGRERRLGFSAMFLSHGGGAETKDMLEHKGCMYFILTNVITFNYFSDAS